MTREIVSTDKAPAAVGPYSQGIKTDCYVFTAGQLGIVPGTKEFAGTDIESQTRQALQNLEAVVKAAGSCLEHVVKTTVFLVNMDDYAAVNKVYAEFFGSECPAPAAVEAARLPKEVGIEIEAIALVA